MARGGASIFDDVRRTPEVILWALAIFVAGVVLQPLVHLVDHRADHVHGPLEAQAHERGSDHGAGSQAHFAATLLEAEPVGLAAAVAAFVPTAPPVPSLEPALERYLLEPLRPGAP